MSFRAFVCSIIQGALSSGAVSIGFWADCLLGPGLSPRFGRQPRRQEAIHSHTYFGQFTINVIQGLLFPPGTRPSNAQSGEVGEVSKEVRERKKGQTFLKFSGGYITHFIPLSLADKISRNLFLESPGTALALVVHLE